MVIWFYFYGSTLGDKLTLRERSNCRFAGLLFSLISGSGRTRLQISGNVPASYRQVSMPLHTVGGLLRYRKRKPLKASPRPSRRPPPCFCTLHALARCFPPFLAFLSTCLHVYTFTCLHVYMFTNQGNKRLIYQQKQTYRETNKDKQGPEQ